MAWFKDWFDSHYYHLLYNNRNEVEAAAFIDKLLDFLHPKTPSRMLDLACGKGRHALQLATKGHEVIGVDLSEQSILAARNLERDNLAFYTLDMRRPYMAGYFDYVFSFFTSFGYFDTEREDVQVFRAIAQNLKPQGIFVLDFMNAIKVIRTLAPFGEKTADNVHFQWHKRVENGFIYKKIEFTDAHQKEYSYEERVRAFHKEDINQLLQLAGMKPIAIFGNYELAPFDEINSDRLIIVAQKG
ncbi:MAG: hypothetical protein RI894_662 [Bacteroidota bacterium]|jgi:SAM-dependent methyltransferase